MHMPAHANMHARTHTLTRTHTHSHYPNTQTTHITFIHTFKIQTHYASTHPPTHQHRHTCINPKSHHDAHTQYLNKAGEHGEHSMGQRVPGMGTLSPRLYRSQHSCMQTPPTAHQTHTHPSQAIRGYLARVLPVPASIDPSILCANPANCTPTPPPPPITDHQDIKEHVVVF